MLNIVIQMIKYYIPWNGFAHIMNLHNVKYDLESMKLREI